MKTIFALALTALLAALAACDAESLRTAHPSGSGGAVNDGGSAGGTPNPQDAASPSDLRSGTSGVDAGSSGTPPAESASLSVFGPNVFRTEELGILVTAPEGTVAQSSERPRWAPNAIAWARFSRPRGKIYSVVVYRRASGQSFTEWLHSSEVGDAYLSPNTVETADGRTAYLYETGDEGGFPDVHAPVGTDNFSYSFKWENGLPDNVEEADRIWTANPEAYRMPDDFREFLRGLRLQ